MMQNFLMYFGVQMSEITSIKYFIKNKVELNYLNEFIILLVFGKSLFCFNNRST